MHKQPLTIVGAGLVGTLLATLLAQRGYVVELFEKRPDPRQAGFAGGRSINLALSERGLAGLRMAGLERAVLDDAVMMRGRMVHGRDGTTNLQRYGIDDSEVNQSVSRGGLNLMLLDAAEDAGVKLHFSHALVGADFDRHSLTFAAADGTRQTHDASVVIGADGAGSATRAAMNRYKPLGERIEPLGHGYKELEIPPHASKSGKSGVRAHFRVPKVGSERTFESAKVGSERTFESGVRVSTSSIRRKCALTPLLDPTFADPTFDPPHAPPAASRFAIEPNALHIWPRGNCMCIALPNDEGSFTVTLFLPRDGAHPSFASVPDSAAARAYFADDYADILPLMPTFDADYDSHPVGSLATLYLERWHIGSKALLVGDAAHAIVPFHGQGMNAGFEDAAILAPLLAEAGDDIAGAFTRFEQTRKPDADAIAAMALENYIEMRDSVVAPDYLRKRELGALLAERAPQHFMPRYRMVTFTRLPYAYCVARGRAQDTLLMQLLRDHADVDSIDVTAAVSTLRSTLPPLPP